MERNKREEEVHHPWRGVQAGLIQSIVQLGDYHKRQADYGAWQ